MSGNPFQVGGQNPFADNLNPYASPQIALPLAPVATEALPPFAGLWRQGDLLIMHKRAPLPDICLKSNQPATRRLKRILTWHHPAIYLTILLHVFVYAIVALILRKTATIHIPLTEEWIAIRWRRMIFSWSTIGLSVLLFAASLLVIDQQTWAPLALIASILLFLGAAIYGLLSCRLVSPKRMTDDYIWLKGVHADFLNRLEPWA